MTQINIDYYLQKAPPYLRPALQAYLTPLLKQNVSTIDSYFQDYLKGDYGVVLTRIISNMYIEDSLNAGIKLNESWEAANKLNKTQTEFKQELLGSMWNIALNAALSSIKVI